MNHILSETRSGESRENRIKMKPNSTEKGLQRKPIQGSYLRCFFPGSNLGQVQTSQFQMKLLSLYILYISLAKHFSLAKN